MPLPIAHSAPGFAAYLCQKDKLAKSLSNRQRLMLLSLVLLATITPDFDFLLGLAIDQPGRYHHGPSHSLLAAFGNTIFFVFLVQNLLNKVSIKQVWLLFSVASFSHPFLDYLTADTSYPFGVPLWWPFSFSFHLSPIPFFQDITRDDASNSTFFSTLFSSHNIKGAWIEIFFSASVLSFFTAIKRRTVNNIIYFFSIFFTFLLIYLSLQFA